MRLTKVQFQEYIFSKVKKIAMEEGWLPAAEVNLIKEEPTIEETLSITNDKAPIEILTEKEFEKVSAPNESVTSKDVKKLTEEFKRMKQLVDFRSPLLIK